MTPSHEPRTILLMFSGGIDSTYLLYHYLCHTELRVHAHHVSMRYPHMQRWRAEDPACDRIVDWCRDNVRDFEYTTSRFDLDFRHIGWDADLHLVVASKVALNLGPGPVTVARGICLDDFEHAAVREREDRAVTQRLWAALRSGVLGAADLDEEIATPIVARGLTKADLVQRLPDELLALTWSCRHPVFVEEAPAPCKNCHACRLRLLATREWFEL